MIAPFAAILFGLSACTYAEEGPATGYSAGFSVGAPLYYADGDVTWRYYDGYTYHLIDHHGRFVGYAYYDYDDFYRIADSYGNIVYYLRWSDAGWRIDNDLGHHLGFIHSDNRGNYWIADRRDRHRSALYGWGRSDSHGHSHARHHDDRVERRAARRQYNAESDRWRNRKHDAEIRHRQEQTTHNIGRKDSRRRDRDRDRGGRNERAHDRRDGRRDERRDQRWDDRDNERRDEHGDDRRRGRRDDRDHDRQRDHGVTIAPSPGASQALPARPQKTRNVVQPRRNRGRTVVQPAANKPAGSKAKGRSHENQRAREPERTRRAPAVAGKPAVAPKPVQQASPRPSGKAIDLARAKAIAKAKAKAEKSRENAENEDERDLWQDEKKSNRRRR